MKKKIVLWRKDIPWYKNFLLADWRDYVLLLLVIVMIVSYKADTQACMKVLESPCDYCPRCQYCPTDAGLMVSTNFSYVTMEEEIG